MENDVAAKDPGNEKQPSSFFYVFIGRDKDINYNKSNDNKLSMDDILLKAFQRLQTSCNSEVEVIVNPKKYNVLRHVFNIKRLPAFGLSGVDIRNIQVKPTPKNPPPWWKLHRIEERNEILNSGEYYPGIQRDVIKLFSIDTDEMFNFIRDVHIANMDGGIKEVMSVVTRILKEKDIKNAGELLGKAKKLFLWG